MSNNIPSQIIDPRKGPALIPEGHLALFCKPTRDPQGNCEVMIFAHGGGASAAPVHISLRVFSTASRTTTITFNTDGSVFGGWLRKGGDKFGGVTEIPQLGWSEWRGSVVKKTMIAISHEASDSLLINTGLGIPAMVDLLCMYTTDGFGPVYIKDNSTLQQLGSYISFPKIFCVEDLTGPFGEGVETPPIVSLIAKSVGRYLNKQYQAVTFVDERGIQYDDVKGLCKDYIYAVGPPLVMYSNVLLSPGVPCRCICYTQVQEVEGHKWFYGAIHPMLGDGKVRYIFEALTTGMDDKFVSALARLHGRRDTIQVLYSKSELSIATELKDLSDLRTAAIHHQQQRLMADDDGPPEQGVECRVASAPVNIAGNGVCQRE